MDFYKDSWQLYKAHSESFHYDFNYYLEFCKDKKTLEAFAGYGRLTNFLVSKVINLSANELSSEFAKSIKLPSHKLNIGNFLDLQGEQYERIIIAYNSFCLITEELMVRKMFSKIEELLLTNGQVSLSYYHPNHWYDETIYPLQYGGQKINYSSKCDLSERAAKKGSWQDIYELGNSVITHDYQLRIYEDRNDLLNMISHTRLRLVDEIRNYNNPEISHEGWIEYVLEKY